MSNFNKQDMELLSEAYTLRLLKESAPHMTLENIEEKLPYMTISEAEYITTVCGRINDYIIQEGLLGGLGNVGGALKRGAQSLGGNLVKGAKAVGQGALGVGRGIGEVGKNIKTNVQNLYHTGKLSEDQELAVQQATEAINELQELLSKITNVPGMQEYGGDPNKIPLSRLQDLLQKASVMAQGQSQAAQDRGITGGGMDAFKSGFNRGKPTGATPPPLPTTP